MAPYRRSVTKAQQPRPLRVGLGSAKRRSLAPRARPESAPATRLRTASISSHRLCCGAFFQSALLDTAPLHFHLMKIVP